MDLINICKMLSSKTRLNILKILSKSNKISAIDLYHFYNKKFQKKRRETLYKELERLSSSGLIEKQYLKENKKLVYELKIKNLNINLLDFEISSF